MKVLKSYLFLTLLCLGLYVPGLSSIPIIDRDEPHYAQTSRQMLETGRYLELKFQNEARHLKPPGIYWLQAGAAYVLSDLNEHQVWPYRIPSVLGALLAVLLTYAFARKLLGEQKAFWGAALLASSLLLVAEAHLSLTDAVLLFNVVLMQGALWKIYVAANQNQKVSFILPVLFWLAMSFGVLIKGVIPIYAGLSILGLALVDRNLRWLKQLQLGWGLGLLLVLSLMWLWPLSMQGKSNFLWEMIRLDLVPKLTGGQQSHGQPPGFFLLSSLVTLWPASLLLLASIAYAWVHRKRAELRFLLAWILPAYLLFECVTTKLPQYLLPIYPALTLVMVSALFSADYTKLMKAKWLRGFYTIWLFISFGLAILIMALPYLLENSISWASLFSACMIIVGSLLVVNQLWRERLKHVALILVLMSLFSFPLLFQKVIPSLSSVWLTERICSVLSTEKVRLNAQHPLLVLDYQEPSLVFRLGTNKVLFTQESKAFSQLRAGASWIIINQKRQSQFERQLRAHYLRMKVVSILPGWPVNSSHKETLILYKKI